LELRTVSLTRAHFALDPAIANLVRLKAREVTHLPGFSRSDQPDIEQELFLHLLQKFACYDPARAKATTFASRVLDNRATSIVRAVRARKRAGAGPVVELDRPYGLSGVKLICRVNALADADARRHIGARNHIPAECSQVKLDVASVCRDLPTPLRKLAALLGYVSPFAAGQILGFSRRQTRAYMAALRQAFEARGLSA